MAQRHRRLWLKMLIGAAVALAIVDALTLNFVFAPLRASQQTRAHTADLTAQLTRSTLDSALTLPTRDPRKPWVTRTPLPTITPWLILTATPASMAPATPMPADASAPGLAPRVPATAALAAPVSTSMIVRSADTPDPTLTSSAGLASARTSNPTPTSPAPIGLTDTPSAVDVLPTATSVRSTSTPSPTRPPDTPQPPPTITAGDAAQFQVYVQDHYNTLAGQQLDILEVTFYETEAGLPKITVYVAGDDTETGFAAQNDKDVADYGHRLLDDAKIFFDGHSCAIAVVSKYDTLYPDPCLNNPTWCTVNAQDRNNHIWNITWTYVLGTSVDGADSVQTRS
jgi:hypothetical protein